ncbi:80 kda mcm3-associated protein [Holotrichia oblita]|uniref:80 kDa mcm3-associated protein n=1 Tax=Holotrichia oblita TaxID=644536 RepID=A0ACB9SYT0_HOLOL|nr:80 kda mcm3-associated protein [Holotrichia oblita]
MDTSIRGKCTEMCPIDETKLRESERLLHILEMIPGTETLAKPRADKNRIVKMYTRSAAGANMSLPKNLRTTGALTNTVNYLLRDVISSKVLPWHLVYDFIADRLLAVRQDMLIQRLSPSHYISLLQPIIRFYTYSAYNLCEHTVSQFDPVLNNKHLQESLKRLLKLYDEIEYVSKKCLADGDSNKHVDYKHLYSDCRPFFEALYIIFNLGDISAIFRGLSLEKKWRTEVVVRALEISMAVLRGNWYRACKRIRKLPTLLAAIASLHLPSIRRDALTKMTIAYSSKILTYPISALQEQLLYSNKTDIIKDCTHYNIKIENDAIQFLKGAANVQDMLGPRHEQFVSEKLSGRSVSNLVLDGDIW